MAIDSEQKRRSSCFPVVPFFFGAILPDGTISATDRQAEAFIYSGIAAQSTAVVGGVLKHPIFNYVRNLIIR